MTVPTAVHWLALLGYDCESATYSVLSFVVTWPPPPKACLPAGHETVAATCVPAVAAAADVTAVPGTRLLPAAPVGPVAPVAPAGPVAPDGPVGPDAPVTP